jgi:hypothetical protein
MMTFIYIAVFCAVAFAVSALIHRWMKTYVLYVFASATISAILLQLLGIAYYGRIDEWAYIAFFVTWVIAFACATVYFIAVRTNRERSDRPET